MIRYMAITEDQFKKAVADNLDDTIWFMRKKPPNVPFIKLKVSIVEQEERFPKSAIEKTKEITILGFTVSIRKLSQKREASSGKDS
jgi:hypothetical protein